MADTSNLESILAALATQKQGSVPTAVQPQGQGAFAPGAQHPPGALPAASYPLGYPQPTTSGSLDLSAAVKPTTSGSVSIQEAIARAKAHAAQNGVASYDRPINYAPPASSAASAANTDARRYRSSRSRSPPPSGRRSGGGDGFNPYRDERRDELRRDRDYSIKDRSYSPGPRGRDRPSRHGRSPPRNDENVEIMEVDASLVGLIIGRQGENMRRVEADSQCRVQFLSPANPSDPTRQCKITGPPTNRAEAKAAIYHIIEEGGAGSGLVAAPVAQPVAKEGEENIQIMVPDRTVGLIIGRGGETIRDLQERSGCHINIVGETKSVNGLRPVNLIGDRASTTFAKELIMEVVDSDTRGGPGGASGGAGGPQSYGGASSGGGYGSITGGGGGGGGDRINDSMVVPAEAIGMIIGKGGETIREMQTLSGCKINVSQTPMANEDEREVGLIGSREAIELAKQAIEEKVEAVRQKNSGDGGGFRGGYGGGRSGRGGHGGRRDADSSDFGGAGRGRPSTGMQGQPPSIDDQNADPYAPYGGYAAYVALWYQALAQQQQQGDAPPAPGAGGNA